MLDVQLVRSDFPILSRQVHGKQLVDPENGASVRKPEVVIDAISHACAQEYVNVHRGLHTLSNLATDTYERVRGIVSWFPDAAKGGVPKFPAENEPFQVWLPVAGVGCHVALFIKKVSRHLPPRPSGWLIKSHLAHIDPGVVVTAIGHDGN